MAINPFLNYQQFVSKPPRNSVDLSFRSNGTFSLGTLYPVFCKEVDPGDTFSIESAFGLKFLPMPFPVQTPMRATMHFYYVRNRTIWKDFVDFIYNNKSANNVPHPYIVRPASDKEFWKTGGIADRLGVPTTIVTDGVSSVLLAPGFGINYSTSPVGSFSSLSNNNCYFTLQNSITSNYSTSSALSDPRPVMLDMRPNYNDHFWPYVGQPVRSLLYSDVLNFGDSPNQYVGFFFGSFDGFPFSNRESVDLVLQGSQVRTSVTNIDLKDDLSVFMFVQPSDDSDIMDLIGSCEFTIDSVEGFEVGSTNLVLHLNPTARVPNQAGDSYIEIPYDDVLSSVGDRKVWFFVGQNETQFGKYPFFLNPSSSQTFNTVNFVGSSASIRSLLSDTTDLDNNPSGNPFAGDDPALPISALPFRAYESIYNAYYRAERLEPLMIDGVAEYNKYCPSMDSGADDFPYRLYQRNWEADFLTSSLPTPQQGVAPVVGVAGLSDIQIQDPDSNEVYNFSAEVDGTDGETVVGGSFHDPGATTAVRRTAQEIVTAGFTINDFRNVNALQRWFENNLRRGLKYRDQVLANTGVKVRYDELDMPEFIGGFSRPVTVSSITQTAPGGVAGVGDYAGQANCFGQSNHRIQHYCDEAGFIMGILCITPQPVYSQLLPKHFLKRTALDYHHPVLNHIGMQPITYDQVCPLQVFASNPTQEASGVRFNDVFGYQRPFYDLLQSYDEVHGLMRTTMRNYVMNRTFSDVPELGADFIHVDPDQLNDVFAVTNGSTDVIMGEILFRCFARRTVSLFGQPKIV